MVPEHRLIPVAEEEKLLKSLGIAKTQLPKIRKSDPSIKVLEKINGEIEPGRVIEITRKSKTSGIAKIYRVVLGE
jgi:DNA-directed RNA polymerase subunit H